LTVRVIIGDAIERLRELPAGTVLVCICSPPYFGLRAYLPDDHPDKHLEIGGEATPAELVEKLVAVFAEVRRVLRDDGTLWLNCGDAYSSGDRVGHGTRVGYKQQTNRGMNGTNDPPRPPNPPGYKPGDRIMLAAMLSEALRADGWWLRDAIPWVKTSPMPESIQGWRWERHRVKTGERDEQGRPVWVECPGCAKCLPNDGLVLRKGSWRHTNSYEWVFQFAKSAEYFGDGEAVREPTEAPTGGRQRAALREDVRYVNGEFKDYHDGRTGRHQGYQPSGRNPRNVWIIGPDPLTDEHYAAFPREIPRRAILASTSAKGCCPACGAPWARVVERSSDLSDREPRGKAVTSPRNDGSAWNENGGRGFMPVTAETLGWRSTCSCDAGEPVPATVLDCFGGSGTTGLVADQLGRDAILIELSPDYAAMAERRISSARARRMIGEAPRAATLPGQLEMGWA
jgi:DNA modification methylase